MMGSYSPEHARTQALCYFIWLCWYILPIIIIMVKIIIVIVIIPFKCSTKLTLLLWTWDQVMQLSRFGMICLGLFMSCFHNIFPKMQEANSRMHPKPSTPS